MTKTWRVLFHTVMIDRFHKALQKMQNVSGFYLAIGNNGCLWYKSITLVDNNLIYLQGLFCRQICKLGHTQEELFQKGRSIQFDENVDIIDSYILWLRQCIQMVWYNEVQVLELFKITLPTRYYIYLFKLKLY